MRILSIRILLIALLFIIAGFYFLGVFYTLFNQAEVFTATFVWSIVYWFFLFGTLFT